MLLDQKEESDNIQLMGLCLKEHMKNMKLCLYDQQGVGSLKNQICLTSFMRMIPDDQNFSADTNKFLSENNKGVR